MLRRVYTLLLSLFFLQSVSQNLPEQKILWETEAKAHASFLTPPLKQASDNYDVKYHRMQWDVDPAVKYIKGNITTFFIPDDTLTQLEFDLSLFLTVDSVKYHQSTISFLQIPGDILQLNFPITLSGGQLDSVTVYYQGVPASSGFGSFIQSSHNSIPIVWTLSEPYGAKDWWPCKQNLNDKIDSIDVIVTTPQAYRVASNGLLVSEDTIGSDKIYHWKSRYPIAAYLIAIAVTNYAYYYDYAIKGSDTVKVLNYVYPENLATAQTQTKGIIPILNLYDSLIAPYPFKNEKYGHAQFGWGGGMEHQTMSFMGGFGHALMAHECAHQWFGDKITCGSWEDIWLNEGFATYMEGLTQEYLFPANWKQWKHGHKSYIISEPGGSVKCTDTTNVSRIFNGRLSYSKGAYVLHMLRWVLGDSLFFQGIKNYINDSTLAFDYARTLQLKNHLGGVSGKDLTSFFDQWYEKEGYPTYTIRWGYQQGSLTIIADQMQSHSSVSFFQMPLPIQLKNNNYDTTLVIDHLYSGQAFTFSVPFQPDSVFFDPEQWILSGINTVKPISPLDEAEGFFHVYPNPVKELITIELYNYYNFISGVEIINSLGMRVVKNDYSSASLRKIEVPMPSLAPGVYFVKVQSGPDYSLKKIIKIRSE